MTTTNTETATEDTQTPGQDSTEAHEGTGTPPETSNAGEGHTEPEDDTSKLRREAAAHRVAAREAREELEATSGRLKTAQDALLAAELRERRVQITADALNAVGLRDSVFDESGGIDSQALSASLATAEDTFGMPLRRRPAPDLTAGRETPPSGDDRHRANWGNLIRR